jgi:hypothetical protein
MARYIEGTPGVPAKLHIFFVGQQDDIILTGNEATSLSVCLEQISKTSTEFIHGITKAKKRRTDQEKVDNFFNSLFSLHKDKAKKDENLQ